MSRRLLLRGRRDGDEAWLREADTETARGALSSLDVLAHDVLVSQVQMLQVLMIPEVRDQGIACPAVAPDGAVTRHRCA